MKDERDCVYDLEVEVLQLNENQAMKLSSYQTLFARLAEKHLVGIEADFNETMKHGYAWALVSLSLEVAKPIDSCLTLRGETWFSQRKGPYFRREFLFSDTSGTPMFRGCTYSVLLEIETRSVYRKKELPVPLTTPIEEFNLVADPHFKTDLTFFDVERRRVRDSFLDALGHVNNCRYGEFAYDALTDEERSRIHELTRMDIYFHSELRKGDTFTIQKAQQDPTHEDDARKIFFRGANETKGDTSFHIVLQM